MSYDEKQKLDRLLQEIDELKSSFETAKADFNGRLAEIRTDLDAGDTAAETMELRSEVARLRAELARVRAGLPGNSDKAIDANTLRQDLFEGIRGIRDDIKLLLRHEVSFITEQGAGGSVSAAGTVSPQVLDILRTDVGVALLRLREVMLSVLKYLVIMSEYFGNNGITGEIVDEITALKADVSRAGEMARLDKNATILREIMRLRDDVNAPGDKWSLLQNEFIVQELRMLKEDLKAGNFRRIDPDVVEGTKLLRDSIKIYDRKGLQTHALKETIELIRSELVEIVALVEK